MTTHLIARSKAPLRLGLAGGGTDVSPYSDEFGGCVLNATISLYAHCTIELIDDGSVDFIAKDLQQRFRSPCAPAFDCTGPLTLHKAIYNRIVRDFNQSRPLRVRVTTYSDALPGSGLGSSSTMVVAILAAYRELLNLALGEYDLSHLAYEIERIDCGLAGGKQDQYAATFGGFNFIEFYNHDRVIVNPLRVRRHIENELEERLMLYFTGVSRSSADIIIDQIHAATSPGLRDSALDAMHSMKKLAFEMKERLLKGDINGVIDQFRESWDAKKRMSAKISTAEIEAVAHAAMASGARAFKIAGAGGGGFMMIFVDPSERADVQHALQPFSGVCHHFSFTQTGVEAWRARC